MDYNIPSCLDNNSMMYTEFALCGNHKLHCCTFCPVPCTDIIISISSEGAGSLWSMTGMGMPSLNSHPKRVISTDSSGGECWSAAFQSMIWRWARSACCNKLDDVGGRAMTLGLFSYCQKVGNEPTAMMSLAIAHIKQWRRIRLPWSDQGKGCDSSFEQWYWCFCPTHILGVSETTEMQDTDGTVRSNSVGYQCYLCQPWTKMSAATGHACAQRVRHNVLSFWQRKGNCIENFVCGWLSRFG